MLVLRGRGFVPQKRPSQVLSQLLSPQLSPKSFRNSEHSSAPSTLPSPLKLPNSFPSPSNWLHTVSHISSTSPFFLFPFTSPLYSLPIIQTPFCVRYLLTQRIPRPPSVSYTSLGHTLFST